jgi:hypothetical protein
MRIDNTTTITSPTITLSWSWVVPNILIFAKYENERNSYGRSIGQFTYNNGWIWQPNEGNTSDVNEYFSDLSITDLNIENLSYYEPPTLYPYAIEIPEIYLWVFPDNKFVLNKFEIHLDTINGVKCVNLAYFNWQAFRDELDSGNHEYLKRSLMPLWDYVELQVKNQNFILL